MSWNPVSWNPTPKEGGLLTKVVPKHEQSNYVDPLAGIPMGETSSRTRRYSWDPRYATCILVYNLMSTLVILPSFMWEETLFTLVHLVVS